MVNLEQRNRLTKKRMEYRNDDKRLVVARCVESIATVPVE